MNLKLKENKWLYAFIITCVALVAALVVAIVLGVQLNSKPEYTEGDEVGVYYYDVADGEILLTLSGGGKFTIAGPGMNKTGSYTATDDGFAFDFIRDEDGTATATISGDTVKFVYGDTTMSFIKKINYTVGFSVDGGSAVASQTVVNGKTANKPGDPSKDGYVFIGWYKDAAFTNVYDFASEVIKADTVVYAMWAEKGAIGTSEYTIDFNLGYEGGSIADITTIGGKAYGVPTPTRDGYTFGGWWISMYEDASKLTYAYTADTVFEYDTTLFAVWHDNASTKLPAPAASVSASTVKWDSVSGALSYKVVITDAAGNEIAVADNLGTTNYSFDFSAYPAGEYTVKVTAVSTSADKTSEAAVRVYANKTLKRASGFNVINGMLIFGAVDGAEKYYITVDCGNDEHKHDYVNNGGSTVYNLANCDMQEGGIKITVTAVAEGYASSVSETYVYERHLDKVPGVTYDAASDTFVWTPVANTTYYYVEIVVGNNTYKFNNGNKTTFSAAEYSGDITIKITPVTDGFNSPEAATATCNKLVPAAPTGITAKGTVISWNAVEGANSYIVKVGNAQVKVDTNSYNTTDGQITLTANETYEVSVQAINDNGSSVFSKSVKMGYLTANLSVSYNANTVSWAPVLGASNYLVRVNGGETISVSNGCSTPIKLTKAGVNVIEVKYTDIGGSKWASIEVIAYSVTYKSRSLSGEFTEYLAKGDKLTLPETFTNAGYNFEGWYNTPDGAAGNGKKITSNVFVGGGDTVYYANWTPKTYKVTLYTDGFNINNVEHNSQFDATYTKNFTLPVPTSDNKDYQTFIGWYTENGGNGTQLTDENGESVEPYPYSSDITAYPFFDSGVLQYVLRSNGTYAVRAGQYINKVKKVTIPETYDSKPVSMLIENSFYNCSRLVSIKIPDTIELIGTGSFSGCTSLENIEIYKAGEEGHEIFYFSDDGALVRKDFGTNYLEVVPRAKTGTYVMSEEINVIRDKAFEFSSLTSVVISKSVTTVASHAFYCCYNIESIDFVEGRVNGITFENDSFYRCTAIKSFKIPKSLNNVNINMLQSLTTLTNITVEKGHMTYGSVAGLLTDNFMTTIVYAPAAYVSGDFTIPNGIQHIGERAFENCVGLTSVTVPNYVQSIGNRAFFGCRGIKNVTFAGDRKYNALTIGENAFASCSNITGVTFGGSADGTTLDAGSVTIGNSAFAPTSSSDAKITKVTFGDGANIASIGDNAFANQKLITSIVFGTGEEGKVAPFVGTIGNRAFYNCQGITSITIPASTTRVGDSAFSGCTHLSSITIANGSTELQFGSSAFANTGLLSVYIPASVTALDGTTFSGCKQLKEIVVDPANTSLKSVYGALYDFGLTSLKFYPYALVSKTNNGSIRAIDLPQTLTTIEPNVFKGNTSLTGFEFGENIRVIGDHAFDGCSQLATIKFNSSSAADATLTIGDYAFNGIKSTPTFTGIPAYVTSIGNRAFYNLKFNTLPVFTKLETIGDYAFYKNTSLTSFKFPATLKSIGNAAFSGCNNTNFKTLDIAGGDVPLTIGTSAASKNDMGAFYNTRFTKVELPDRVTEIGAYAFYSGGTSNTYAKITSFKAGANLKVIGNSAFCNQTYLTSVTLNEGLQNIDDSAFNSTKLSNVIIPNTVTHIGASAFANTKAAKDSYTFATGGNAPIVIEANAFSGSKMTTFEIPARALAYKEDVANTLYGITTVGKLTYKTFDQIFNACNSLQTITVAEGSTQFKSIGGIVYTLDENGNATTLLYCPRLNPGENGTVTIPKEVTLVENRAFYNVTKISKVVFEEYATGHENYKKPLLYLGNYVESGDGKNERVEEYGVFSGKSNSIKTIELPSHLAYIGTQTFVLRGSSTAHDVNLIFNKEATVMLAENAIYYLDTEKLELPNISELHGRRYIAYTTANEITFGENSSFTTMPKYGIDGCNNITSFKIPASVTTISGWAFMDCEKLATIDFSAANKVKSFDGTAFYNLPALTSFTFPESVTTIGNNVFSGCNNIKTVTLPSGLQSFSANILSGCTSIETVIFENNPIYEVIDGAVYDKAGQTIYYYPAARATDEFTIKDSVINIAEKAFYAFPGAKVNLPSKLQTVGANAFMYSKVTEINLPATVTSIGEYAFSSCESLKTFYMDPNSAITHLSKRIFDYDTALTSVTISDNIQTMGEGMFYRCESLESIILPAALNSIPNYTLEYCESLTSVVIPDGVESIGNQAFAYGNLTSPITIPAAVKKIDNFAFKDQEKLPKVIFEKDSVLTEIGTKAFSGCASLTEIDLSVAANFATFALNPDTGLAETFDGCTSLNTVKLANTSVKNIPTSTFAGLTKLSTLTLPETLEKIGTNAFKGAASLTGITIPATVNSIGTGAFENCTGLKTVTFEDGSVLTTLGTTANANDNIFKNTTNLETVILPTGLTLIGGHVFENSGVTNIYQNNGIAENSLPAALTTIGEYAFANCSNITDVVIIGNVSYIGNYAFNGCSGMQNLMLSEGISYIGELAFGYCSSLKAVNLPQSISTLQGNPFAGCSGLKSFTLHEDNTAYKFVDGVLYDWNMTTLICVPASLDGDTFELDENTYYIASGAFTGAQIKYFYVPNRIEEIPAYGFSDCKNLETITFGYDVMKIGAHAFEGCDKLNEVEIPSGISIDDYAFAKCIGLTDFSFSGSYYTLGTHIFDGCTALEEIIVPSGMNSIPDYMFANTGLVNVEVPANITNLNTEGVFANNTKLKSIQFLGVDFSDTSTVIGVKYFQNCTALTTVKDKVASHPANYLPSTSERSFAGCIALKYAGNCGANMFTYIGEYAFEGCIGLENFYFTIGESQDGIHGIFEIKDYAFKDCTGIKKLYVIGGPYAGQAYPYHKGIFDGWTSEQTIIFLNDFSDGNGGIDNTWHYAQYDKEHMLDGCNAKIVTRDELFSTETVTIDYCGIYGDISIHGNGMQGRIDGFIGLSDYDFKTLNIGELAKSFCMLGNDGVLVPNAFSGFTSEQTINFTAYTYEELMDLFDERIIWASAFTDCEARVFDKDGYELIIDDVDGIVDVLDEDGVSIFE